MVRVTLENGPEQRGTDSISPVLKIVLAAFAIRLVVMYFTWRGLPNSEEGSRQFGWEMGWVARSLASGQGYSSPFFHWSGPTAFVPPLYPFLLAGVFRLFGIYSLTSEIVILTINSVFSALTCIPVYFSAEYVMSGRGARVAAWAWALYPFAIYFSVGRIWDYSLTALLFTTVFCISLRMHGSGRLMAWLGWGLLCGLTALSNPAVLSVIPFLLALALWKAHRSGSRWLAKGVVAAIGLLLAVVPWTIRNYRVLGIVCPIRDNFWHEFYAANFGDTSDCDPIGKQPTSNPEEMRKFLSMGEVAYMAQQHRLAVEQVKQHPLFVAGLTARRVVFYWSGFWTFASDYMQREPTEVPNMFYCGGVTLLMLRGARRLWTKDRARALPFVVAIVFFPLVFYITHPIMDYRQPIESVILILAVAGALPMRWVREEGSGAAETEQAAR